MKLFAKLMKVDVAKRQVWGRATQEVPDKSGEIFDYETSVPHFKDWSASFEKATEILGEAGKSLGNIRAMHGRVAAGKVIAIDFNDADKAIDIGTEITDDAEWGKVLKGTYTGFSIGGAYVKQWKDDASALTRFTAKPAEISIVDNPCVPTATFSMVKADGAVEEVPFTAAEPPAADPVAPPAPTHTPAPDAPVAQADGAEEAIVAEATKAFLAAHQAELDAAIALAKAAAAPAPVKKSIYQVSNLADVLSSIRYLCVDTQYESEWEKDGSKIPEQLREWLKTGVELLLALTAEEAAEMLVAVTPVETPMALAADGELTKRASDLEKAVSDLTAERDTLTKRVAQLEAEPAPPKGVVRIVGKTDDDHAASDTIELPAPTGPNDLNFSKAVMRAVHARGGQIIAAR